MIAASLGMSMEASAGNWDECDWGNMLWGPAHTCFADADGDGYAAPGAATVESCDGDCDDPGEADSTTDCDDTNMAISPDGTEIPGNNVDEDCSGTVVCFEDADGDGFGNIGGFTVVSADGDCDDPGESLSADDCDDAAVGTNPGAADVPGNSIDEDCDNSWVCFVDVDGDGFGGLATLSSADDDCTDLGESAVGTDCNDAVGSIRPNAIDVPGNDIDENCDNAWACYVDGDGDTYGTDLGTTVLSVDDDCTDGGESATADDCQDGNPAISPGASDIPGSGIDEDCTGDYTCYVDFDGDGFSGSSAITQISADADCDDLGEAATADDCNEGDPNTNPDAVDVPGNDLDEDCSGDWVCFSDGDGDGYGAGGGFTVISADNVCTDAGESETSDDCNDSEAGINPGATNIPGSGVDEDCSGSFTCYIDLDGDGFGGDPSLTVTSLDDDCDDPGESNTFDDCDDSDELVNPDAVDVPGNAIDDDCNGDFVCYEDGDGDGFGTDQGFTVISADSDCEDAGESETADDCDDGDSAVSPDADDVPGSGFDSNCDGGFVCYLDLDGDGYAAPGAPSIASADADCTAPGEAATADDCDDTTGLVSPGGTEIAGNGIDEDCSGDWTCFADMDGDGHGSDALVISTDADCDDPGEAPAADDCDDTDAGISPSASDVPGTGIDEDCSGDFTCYVDIDGDGFGGSVSAVLTSADADCTDPGEAPTADDCNDASLAVNPNATEVPGNDIDEDCSGDWDCFVDGDNDTHGSSASVVSADNDCTDPGEAATADDCDDTNGDISPSAINIPGSGIDEDCSGGFTCFFDADGDGYGGNASVILPSADADCDDPNEAPTADDCDDTNALANPGASDIPGNAIDEDCSGDWTCYEDGDGDSYGTDAGFTVISADSDCTAPGESANAEDCDDVDATVSPDAVDVPGSGFDADCSGDFACYVDTDGDGFGSEAVLTSADPACDGLGESPNADDCDDAVGSINPDGVEVAGNDIDEDCSGDWDCVVDGDGDGFGNTDGLVVTSLDALCTGDGEATAEDDCDDADDTVFPGAPEIIGNDIDEDCDGSNLCYQDIDGDGFGNPFAVPVGTAGSCEDLGFAANNLDCNDGLATTNPDAPDTPGNDVDEDCSGDWECFEDGDGDGFGAISGFTVTSADDTCDGVGESTTADDCDDADTTVYPGAPDPTGDGIDQDCSGGFTCFVDSDLDGFGDESGAVVVSADADCDDPGESTTADDCDDGDDLVNPLGEDEPGSGVDANCDGLWSCWIDADGDSYGTDATTLDSVDPDCDDLGESATDDDCDDTDIAIHPDADELGGSGVDSNCDGLFTCFLDQDDDGFGNAGGVTATSVSDLCDELGVARTDDDCDDLDPAIFPDALEIPGNAIDEDCSGDWSCYADADQDGYGDNGSSIVSADDDCSDVGEAAIDGDCEDAIAAVNPDGVEIIGNSVDEDCSGDWDCYVDGDGDGFGGIAGDAVVSDDGDCTSAGESSTADDCDDADPEISPVAVDTPDNGIDEDCSGADAEGTPEIIDDGDKYYQGGCGCGSTPVGSAAWLLLLMVPALRRRRS